MAEDDGLLVAGARGGSDEAFAALVRRHERAVFNLVARIIRDRTAAEDLSQETFVKAYRKLETYDSAYPFANWILRIAHNTAIDYLRRPSLPLSSIDDVGASGDRRPVADQLVSGDPSPESVLARRDVADQLNRAVASLRPEYRRLVILRYQEELGLEAIAEITGLPLGTVKSYLHRARLELAAWWTARQKETAVATRGTGRP